MKRVIAIVGGFRVGKSEVASVLAELGVKEVNDFVSSFSWKNEIEAMSMLSAPAVVYAEWHSTDEQTIATLQANGVHVVEVIRSTKETPDPVRRFPQADSCIVNHGDDLEAFQDEVRQGFYQLLWGKNPVDPTTPAPAAEVAETKPAEAESTAPAAETAPAPTA